MEVPLAVNGYELKRWHDRAKILEVRVNEVSLQLQHKTTQLEATQKRSDEEHEWNQSLTRRVLQEQRARKLMETRVAELEDRLKVETNKQEKLEKDKKDLCRTITRLKDSCSNMQIQTANIQKQAENLEKNRQEQELRNAACRKNMKGMGDFQQALSNELAQERDNQARLKEFFRAKLQEVELQHLNWSAAMTAHDEGVKEWTRRLQEAEALVRTRQLESEKAREVILELQDLTAEQAAKNEEIHRKMRELQRENEYLVDELECQRTRVFEVESKWKGEQKEWRLSHIHRVDRSHLLAMQSSVAPKLVLDSHNENIHWPKPEACDVSNLLKASTMHSVEGSGPINRGK